MDWFTKYKYSSKATGNSATVYYKQDGHYVVRDDITGDLVQMSDSTSPKWQPDNNIVDPYLP